MAARTSSSARRRLVRAAVLLPGLALGGCADYLEHRDTITLAAGDAKTWNSVVHTADPWPPYAATTHIGGHGPRLATIASRYLAATDTAPPQEPTTNPTASAPDGAVATGAPPSSGR